MPELTAGIPVDRLPKTFRDAVVLCLNLDIQYLWIDALCIKQDDTKDWEDAAASMADVYSHAKITIAATWSDDSNRGFFSQMRTELEDMPMQEPGLYVRLPKPDFPRSIHVPVDDSWPLLKRAWVYQERKLSTRMVHMAKEQLYWECDSAFLSEDGYENDRIIFLEDLRSPMEVPANAWRSAVGHYSRLKLTYKSDRLPAISALVKRMQPLREGDVYVAGMWLNTVLQDLAWFVFERGNPTQLSRPDIKCPTWSWAATAYGVHWHSVEDLLPSLRLFDITYDVTGPAHFGQTANASIRLEGPTITARYTTEKSFVLEMINIHGPYQALKGQKIDGREDFYLKGADPPILPGEVFNILLMTVDSPSYGGIILHQLSGEQYQRIGWSRLWYYKTTWPEHAPDWTEEQVLEDFVASLPIKQFTIV
ncbi:hypothetical protein EKO04_004259 [Ascochyta lentis]|uniref:Heterokaryon incompatibility domain-containing protein n=1 Tax=Ascochyta lentis TaxID=205686 RepID=A0A8H7J490_9PLEO|nr:hypothetical protein EKO04_004259 [Ascochyta lentis]